MAGYGRKRIPLESDSVFSKNLHELMDGMRFVDAAELFGTHPETINRYLNHEVLPPMSRLVHICEHYNMPLSILFTPLAEIRAARAAFHELVIFAEFAATDKGPEQRAEFLDIMERVMK